MISIRREWTQWCCQRDMGTVGERVRKTLRDNESLISDLNNYIKGSERY